MGDPTSPCETPKTQPQKRGPLPWMVLYELLFVIVILVGVILWSSATLRQVTPEREMQARQQTKVARKQVMDAIQNAEAESRLE
ncbi:MAG: hypothetical protein P8K08_20235 [Fuerstiella sp.]|nr:hypothetical protein [Fuerstiella sp.]